MVEDNKNDAPHRSSGTVNDLKLGPPRKSTAVHSEMPPENARPKQIHERRPLPMVPERAPDDEPADPKKQDDR